MLSYNGALHLQVDGWIGTVELTNGDQLNIGSKYGDVNFLRMFLRANGIQDYSVEDLVDFGLGDSTPPHQLLVRGFIQRLRQVSTTGRKFAWQDRNLVSRFRPQTSRLFDAAMRAAILDPMPFHGTNQYRSYNNAENRVLVAASRAALEQITLDNFEKEDLALLRSWSAALPLFRRTQTFADLHAVESKLRSAKYYGARGYYRSALESAILILSKSGLTTLGASVITGDGFLVNSDILFETYARNILAESFVKQGFIFSKARPGTTSLFTNNQIFLEPDLLVAKGNQLTGLGDIKHKSPTAEDFYQVIVYAEQFNMKQTFILSAVDALSPQPETTLTTRGRPVSVTVIELPLSDLDVVEQRLENLDQFVDFRQISTG
ncbi:5-methylcytosine restriction system specificity protein McrC [Corynebacterium guangdongense]|uniref:5-methylcytosine-specific restriction enzyme subunit McrC n=1 Tax=Corynebacterium guangdongense TaxID=1783348 RepID=A0ABU1ZWE9_9CORY|nr:hypothetical protein [Corynebacterium guangdongense]MDR7328557.1 hypothetical protein [Corynebacterium guangdongense]